MGPQITIPPIKKRLKHAEDVEPVSKPKTSTKKSEAKGPQQMSIMAFVQKKKEIALEKKVSGYVSPASSSLEEELKNKETKAVKELTRKVEEPKIVEKKEPPVPPKETVKEPLKDKKKNKTKLEEKKDAKEKKEVKEKKEPKDKKEVKELTRKVEEPKIVEKKEPPVPPK